MENILKGKLKYKLLMFNVNSFLTSFSPNAAKWVILLGIVQIGHKENSGTHVNQEDYCFQYKNTCIRTTYY